MSFLYSEMVNQSVSIFLKIEVIFWDVKLRCSAIYSKNEAMTKLLDVFTLFILKSVLYYSMMSAQVLVVGSTLWGGMSISCVNLNWFAYGCLDSE